MTAFLLLGLVILFSILNPLIPVQYGGSLVCGKTRKGYVKCPPADPDSWSSYLGKPVLIVGKKHCGLQCSGTKGRVVGVGGNERAAKFDCKAKGDPLIIRKRGGRYYIEAKNYGCALEWSGRKGGNRPVGRNERVAKFDCGGSKGDPMYISGKPSKFYLRSKAGGRICGFEWSGLTGNAPGVASYERLAKFDCGNSRGDPLYVTRA